MRQVMGWLLASAACVVVGAGFRQAGAWELRAAEADRELATLQYTAASEDYAQLETDAPGGQFARWAWADRVARARAGKAAADYWRSARGATPEAVPPADATAIDANRALDAALAGGDRAEVLGGLDNAIRLYQAVLKRQPDEDVAYNYEFAARVRASVVTAKGNQKPGTVPTPPDASVHGVAGAPPPSADMKVFKMFVPMRPDERKTNQPDAGKGQKKERKG